MEGKFFEEVQELKKEILNLKVENKQLKKFLEIGKVICVERDIDKLIPLIMTKISKAINADRSTLFLVDWDNMELWTEFAEGLGPEKIKIQLKMGLIGVSVFTRKLVNVSNVHNDPRFNSKIDEITGYRTESILSVPFFDRHDEVMGAVVLLNNKRGLFKKEDEEKALKTISMLPEIMYSSDLYKDKVKPLLYDLKHSTKCERCSLFMIDREKGELFPLIAERIEGHDIHLSLNLGIAGLVGITGQDLIIQDAYSDPRFDSSTDIATGYRTRCILCIPIKDQSGEIIGVIQAINKKEGVFTDSDKDVLKALSSFVAISLENASLINEQHQQFKSILEVLGASIDAKDPLTAGHSMNVTKYAVGIGRELGFGEKEIDVLIVAALLHDYGKLGTDDNILKKPGKLTPEEFDHIKEHVANTQNILNKMYLMRKYSDVPLIASSHHERLDGSGYISGLKSHEIPFMAKIISVADVFEALTAKRYYHDAISPEDAFDILMQDVGTKFDENIVRSLMQYWSQRTPE